MSISNPGYNGQYMNWTISPPFLQHYRNLMVFEIENIVIAPMNAVLTSCIQTSIILKWPGSICQPSWSKNDKS